MQNGVVFGAAAALALPLVAHGDLLIDFSGLPAGTVIDDEYAGLGVTISAMNNIQQNPDLAIIFDSENPTGGDDDLMTPGIGVGNNAPLGNLLIIAEDDEDTNGDGLIDDPDDEAGGGTIFFNLDDTFTGLSISIVDVEEQGGSLLFFEGGNLAAEVDIPALGDNSAQTILVDNVSFDELRVDFAGSAGIGQVEFVPTPATGALLALGGLVMMRRRR